MYLPNTAHLYGHAVKAYEGMRGAPGDRTMQQSDALTSIVFAAASLEAFMNELTAYLAFIIGSRDVPDWAVTLHHILDEAEEYHASIQMKYLLTSFVLTGKSFSKGDSVYQAFDLLMKLRNAVVHTKTLHSTHEYRDGQWLPPVEPRIISDLRSTGVLADVETLLGELYDSTGRIQATFQANWIDRVSTRAAARWACNASANMIAAIRDGMPDENTRRDLSAYIEPLE